MHWLYKFYFSLISSFNFIKPETKGKIKNIEKALVVVKKLPEVLKGKISFKKTMKKTSNNLFNL